MSKQYLSIGQVLKGKKQDSGETKPDYIKLTSHVQTLENLVVALQDYIKSGAESPFYINLESKAAQLTRVQQLGSEGKMKEDAVEKALERINKIPDFVRFNLTAAVERKDK